MKSKILESFYSPLTMILFFLQMIIAFVYWRISYYQWRAAGDVGILYYGFPFKFDISKFGTGNILEFLGYLFLNLLVYYIIAIIIVQIYKNIKR